MVSSIPTKVGRVAGRISKMGLVNLKCFLGPIAQMVSSIPTKVGRVAGRISKMAR